jgi:ammonium transporter, Amt family
MLKNLLDACFGAICFYFVGYGFAYGGDKGNAFIGYGGFVLKGETRDLWYNWFFQFAVCLPSPSSSGILNGLLLRFFF